MVAPKVKSHALYFILTDDGCLSICEIDVPFLLLNDKVFCALRSKIQIHPEDVPRNLECLRDDGDYVVCCDGSDYALKKGVPDA